MKQKRHLIIGLALLILTTLPLASAHAPATPTPNRMRLATIQLSGYNGTIYPFGHLFINHKGVCAYMRVWTLADGHIELHKVADPSSNIVLEGNQTITLIGFLGYAVAGGNCSSGHCDPMDVHGTALLVTW